MPPIDAVSRLPSVTGVYRFRNDRGRVLYIGRAATLRSRVGSYWGNLGDRRHLAPMVARIARVEAVVCGSEHEAAWLERNLLEQARPRWNRVVGGAETPVYIQVDGRPRTPGLSVVHLPQPAPGLRHFGPYLGGTQARLAVTALHRVMPMAYAATGADGSVREMARIRGVDERDREGLVDAVAAILRREPAAVAAAREALLERRSRAADGLAFELAARVQSELQALEWVTSMQRVTSDEPVDADIAGWAGGILVRFRIRAGRLSGWEQRACTLTGARRHLAASPPAWADFANHNAELAIRLATGPAAPRPARPPRPAAAG